MKYKLYILNKLKNVFSILFAKCNNKNLFIKGKISKIEYVLRKDFLKNNEQFGITDFYQSFPPLKISGSRNSLCRYNVYNLKNILNKKMRVLDIGGNIGFFSAYISKYVKEVIIVEKNKNLINVCKKLLQHQKIKNIKIFNKDFKEFIYNKKFDLILSLAIHKWIGLSLKDYFKKISLHMNKNSLLLFESHILYNKCKENNIEQEIKNIPFIKIIRKGYIDDHNGNMRLFFYIKLK